MNAPKFRPLKFGVTRVSLRDGVPGTHYLTAEQPLQPFAERMTDMMLTGRVYNATDGERLGFAQYLVPQGTALDKAVELATRIATNAPLTNYALMHALPRIAEQPADHGFLTEALMSSIAQSAPEAKARVRAFLEGKAAKVQKAN